MNAMANLPLFHQRLQSVTVENTDWREIIAKYDGPGPGVLFYFDPPYVQSTRVSPKGSSAYEHEFADDEHRALVRALLRMEASVIISGYYSELYEPLQAAGWRRFDKYWHRSAPVKKGKGDVPKPVESIWVSPGLVRWVSFIAPCYGWREATNNEKPPRFTKKAVSSR
jgi:DNA adenine methylase